jgi:hypothetical protein
MHEDAGTLFHVFMEGYFIYDEAGRAVSTFEEEEEFNRLIKKFRHREFMREDLQSRYDVKLSYGPDNALVIDDAVVDGVTWGLPQNSEDQEAHTLRLVQRLDAYCAGEG